MTGMPNAERYLEIRKQIVALEAEMNAIEADVRAELDASEDRMVTDGRVSVRLRKAPWAGWNQAEFAKARPALARAITVKEVCEDMVPEAAARFGIDERDLAAAMSVPVAVFEDTMLPEAAARFGIDERDLAAAMSVDRLDFDLLRDEAARSGQDFKKLQQTYRAKGKAALTRTPAEASEREMKLHLWAQLGEGKRRPCSECGDLVRFVDLELDHVHPQSDPDGYDGDIDAIDNRQLICGNCNRKKGNIQ